MKKSLFRKSSIDRVQSPEQLNDYIKVSNPSVWIIIIAIIVLLVAVIIWSVFGTLKVNKNVSRTDENNKTVNLLVTEEVRPIDYVLN